MAEKKEKIESLTEDYKYVGEGEVISDISASEPLKPKKKIKKVEVVEENIEEPIIEQVIVNEPTQRDIYISMIQENRPFTLKIAGNVIFDSENGSIMSLSFEEEHFRVGVNKYSYDGLNFKFKK